jgi:2-polyprenyl-6-methoxyphenol hydroxylase-like FAD-dependent oxidoreductase
VRRSLYTVEAPPQYEGIMMWRGAREQAPYLDGETMFIAGNHDLKVVCYPISAESARRGSSLVNWVAEVRFDAPRPLHPGDWTRRGGREFIERFTEFNLGFIDVRQLFLDTEDIYEFPMIDRDPLPRWSFGRVTLLGDAAHAMLPIGANGTSQAILDAAALAESVHTDDVVAGLQAYERRRIGPTATVVLSNREYLPERYLDLADQRLRGPDDRVEDLISPAEIDEITRSYRQLAGFDVDELNRKGLK